MAHRSAINVKVVIIISSRFFIILPILVNIILISISSSLLGNLVTSTFDFPDLFFAISKCYLQKKYYFLEFPATVMSTIKKNNSS